MIIIGTIGLENPINLVVINNLNSILFDNVHRKYIRWNTALKNLIQQLQAQISTCRK